MNFASVPTMHKVSSTATTPNLKHSLLHLQNNQKIIELIFL